MTETRGCCGRCDQGREPCPHPDLCEQQDAVPWGELLTWRLWPLALIVGLGAWVVW